MKSGLSLQDVLFTCLVLMFVSPFPPRGEQVFARVAGRAF